MQCNVVCKLLMACVTFAWLQHCKALGCRHCLNWRAGPKDAVHIPIVSMQWLDACAAEGYSLLPEGFPVPGSSPPARCAATLQGDVRVPTG